jgi:hypothetical protein
MGEDSDDEESFSRKGTHNPAAPEFKAGVRVVYLLNYARSRNPTCTRAHTHRHIQALREPLTSRVCWRVCTLPQYRT